MRDASGRMFEADGLTQSIRSCADKSTMEMRDCLLSALKKHSGGAPRSDDITLVIVRLGGAAA